MSSQNIEAGITLGTTTIGAGVGAFLGGLPGAAIGGTIGKTVGDTVGLFIRDDKPLNKFTLSMTKSNPYAGYRLGDIEKDYSFKKSQYEGNSSTANTLNTITTVGLNGLQVASSVNDFKTILKEPNIKDSTIKGSTIKENMEFVDKNKSMSVPEHLNNYKGFQLSNFKTTPLFENSFQLQPTVKLEGNESVIYKNNNRIVLK